MQQAPNKKRKGLLGRASKLKGESPHEFEDDVDNFVSQSKPLPNGPLLLEDVLAALCPMVHAVATHLQQHLGQLAQYVQLFIACVLWRCCAALPRGQGSHSGFSKNKCAKKHYRSFILVQGCRREIQKHVVHKLLELLRTCVLSFYEFNNLTHDFSLFLACQLIPQFISYWCCIGIQASWLCNKINAIVLGLRGLQSICFWLGLLTISQSRGCS